MRFSLFSSIYRSTENVFRRPFGSQNIAKTLKSVPKIEIGEGSILYLMISLYIHGESLFARTIIRGRPAKQHLDIYKKFRSEMKEKGLCTRALGGGILNVDGSNRTIKIYGKCNTFGRANHRRTKQILKESSKYRNYKISVSK